MRSQKALGYFNQALLDNQFVIVKRYLDEGFPVNEFVRKI